MTWTVSIENWSRISIHQWTILLLLLAGLWLALASLHTPAPRSYFYFFSENHSPNKKYELPSNILRKLIRVPTLGNFHRLSQTEDV